LRRTLTDPDFPTLISLKNHTRCERSNAWISTTAADCREKAALFAGEISISAGICIPQAKIPGDRRKMKLFVERFMSPAARRIFRRLFRRAGRFRRRITG
jgi:hypothetical protein